MTIDEIKKDVRFAQRLMRLAGYNPGAIDGAWGPKTAAAWQMWQTQAELYKNTVCTLDERSEKCLATLLPSCQGAIREWWRAHVLDFMEGSGLVVKIIQGTRSYAEQDALYAQGRTKGGAIVTKARGGYSNHNFGVAFDVGIFRNGKYVENDAPYKGLYTACGVPQGFLWGGDWTSIVDYPHYQLAKYGSTTARIRAEFQK